MSAGVVRFASALAVGVAVTIVCSLECTFCVVTARAAVLGSTAAASLSCSLATRARRTTNPSSVRCPPRKTLERATRLHRFSCAFTLHSGIFTTVDHPGISLPRPSHPIVPNRRLVSPHFSRTFPRAATSFVLRLLSKLSCQSFANRHLSAVGADAAVYRCDQG